jgi:TolC family type I secretion outer membrane protein
MATVLLIGLSACTRNRDITGSLCVAAGESAVARCAEGDDNVAAAPIGADAESAAPPGPQELGQVIPSPPVLLPPVDNISRGEEPKSAPASLSASIAQALEQNPEIGVELAKAKEALAGIGVARAGLYPQFEGRVAAGWGAGGNYTTPWGSDYFDPTQTTGSLRGEAGLSAQQLLYDFGATENDVNRSKNSYQSKAEAVVDKTEDLSQRVAEAYLKILEQTELVAVANQNMAELQRIAKLVQDNETNGNATTADTKRVKARLSEADQNRIDAQLGLQLAGDQFRLLVGSSPGKLTPAPLLLAALPSSPDAAIAIAERRSPRLKASESAIRAAKNEIDAIKGQGAARVELQGDYVSKNYAGVNTNSELDARAMLAVRYKFLDGGLNSSKIEEAAARLHREEMLYRFERDDLHSRLRQAYQSLGSAQSKRQQIQDGLQASSKARELYLQQFSGGKRSLLELLDVQASWYLARRNDITNRFDVHKSSYTVLRSLGQLTQALLATKSAPAQAAKKAPATKQRAQHPPATPSKTPQKDRG